MIATEFQKILVPLGRLTPDGAFVAVGAGILLEFEGFDWLVTLRRFTSEFGVLAGGEAQSLLALVRDSSGEEYTLNFEAMLQAHRLDWVVSETTPELVAAPIPISSEWSLRSIPQELTVSHKEVLPSDRCFALEFAYSLGSDSMHEFPTTLTFDGIIAGCVGTDEFLFTAPVLARSCGAPLFAAPRHSKGSSFSSSAALAGIILEERTIGTRAGSERSAAGSEQPQLRVGRALAVERAYELLASAAGLNVVARVREAALQ